MSLIHLWAHDERRAWKCMGIIKRESSGSYSLVRDGQERQTVASQEHREVGFPVGEQCSADITVVLLSPEQASSMMVSKEFCDDCHFSKEAILRVGVEGLFFSPPSLWLGGDLWAYDWVYPQGSRIHFTTVSLRSLLQCLVRVLLWNPEEQPEE